MNPTLLIAVLTAVVALIGTAATYWLGRRNTSGAIDTSVAADLWNEGGKIRAELRTDLADTKSALTAATTAVTALNDELRLSREKTDAALEESRLSRQETRELKAQIVELTTQITELHRAQIDALTAQTTKLTEQTSAVSNEVKTKNGITLGGLADNAETRRILAISEAERTEHEREHLRTAADRLPDDLAADQTKDTET
ncbi:MAG: hypothetical protein ACR2NB_12020 [Solirubrobacteraceae bacterium]